MNIPEAPFIAFACVRCRETKAANLFGLQILEQGFFRADSCGDCSREIESLRLQSRRQSANDVLPLAA
jgi:formate dehydrogenase maturation protein FdhE